MVTLSVLILYQKVYSSVLYPVKAWKQGWCLPVSAISAVYAKDMLSEVDSYKGDHLDYLFTQRKCL